ncbi:MAG: AmmeMemoRadiSam system protein B [Planctomycetota bacterium]
MGEHPLPADPDGKLPALRGVEVLPFRRGADVYFALRDPLQLADSIVVSGAGCFILAHLDGEHSCADIARAFRRRAGLELPQREIRQLVQALDEALLLHGPRFERALAERRAAYAAAPVRDNRDRYPAAAALRATLRRIIARGAATPPRTLRGLIAPHLDYERGAPCYAAAYAALSAFINARMAGNSRPVRFVLLGTNHGGLSSSVVLTTKDFLTPLGRATTDRAFIDRIAQRLRGKHRRSAQRLRGENGRSAQRLRGENGPSADPARNGHPAPGGATAVELCADEIDHFGEHSVELQLHFIQVLMEDRPFQIVPVLCPDVCGPNGTAARDGRGPDLADFADALGALIAADRSHRTIVIAGADLSHVGQRFGDANPTTPAFLEQVAASDRALLDLLGARREEDFRRQVRDAENATRICSTGCIYALLRALPGRPCRVLAYHQAVDHPAETYVACAAALVS